MLAHVAVLVEVMGCGVCAGGAASLHLGGAQPLAWPGGPQQGAPLPGLPAAAWHAPGPLSLQAGEQVPPPLPPLQPPGAQAMLAAAFPRVASEELPPLAPSALPNGWPAPSASQARMPWPAVLFPWRRCGMLSCSCHAIAVLLHPWLRTSSCTQDMTRARKLMRSCVVLGVSAGRCMYRMHRLVVGRAC